jgi:hypothetical protein
MKGDYTPDFALSSRRLSTAEILRLHRIAISHSWRYPLDGLVQTTRNNMEVMAMIAKLMSAACALVITLPITGWAKKPSGEISDRRALAEVRTYCIEKSGLSGSDRYIVDGFLKSESRPKHLLTKMPWKLVESCADDNPDAIATVEFVRLNSTEITMGNPTGPAGGVTDSRDPEAPVKVVLTVHDSSGKLLYTAQAMPLTSDLVSTPTSTEPPPHGGPVERQDAVYHVFWGLINDLQGVRESTTK